MQSKEFVQFLVSNNIPVFGFNDAIKIMQSSRQYTKLFLHRCIKKGMGFSETAFAITENVKNLFSV